jgi:H+-transporting ATPase
VIVSSVADILIISTLANRGIFMTPLPILVIAGTLVAAVAFGFVLDVVKLSVFSRLRNLERVGKGTRQLGDG